jgi:hypothetical protein
MSPRLTRACRCGGMEPPPWCSKSRATAGKALLLIVPFVLAFIGPLNHLAGLRLVDPANAADAADAGPWLAEQVQGSVRIRASGQNGGGWQPLADETAIAANSEVATGKDGMAVLANGTDRIRLSPNSHIVLPAPAEETGFLTVIRQKLGRVFFDVGPRPERRFEVDAPFLVVLVKGTQFTVRANYMANAVDVFEGTVEVRAADADRPGALVTAGETASIFAGSDDVDVAPSENDAGSAAPGKGGGGEPGSPGPSRSRDRGSENPGGEGEGGGEGGGNCPD